MRLLIELLKTINWSVVFGVFNLAFLLAILRIVSVYHQKQVELLQSLRQSEFVKEIKAFREFYEEKKKVLEIKTEEVEEKAKLRVSLAEERAEDAEVYLKTVLVNLDIDEAQGKRLSKALREVIGAREDRVSSLLSLQLESDERFRSVAPYYIAELAKYTSAYRAELTNLDTHADEIKEDVTELDIEVSIQRIRRGLIPIAEREGKYIELSVHPGVSKVLATKAILETAFYEILENAVSYSPKGTTISIAVTQLNEGEVQVAVRNAMVEPLDTEVERVFQEGYRGKSSEKLLSKGQGLGLYLTKQALGLVGGTVEASTENGDFVLILRLQSLQNK